MPMNDEKIVCYEDIKAFVFVTPGECIYNALHIMFVYRSDDPKCLETNLKFIRRYYGIPLGTLAVFVHDRIKDTYTYHKTIINRRKSFALSSNSK